MPRGGRRPGSGRKPKLLNIKGLQARVLSHPSVQAPDGQSVAPPAILTPAARQIWDVQAPHAIRNKTLTEAQALSFARYCELYVAEQLAGSSEHAGSPPHMTLVRTVNALELQFGLTADGKRVAVVAAEEKAPQSKLGRFRT